MASKYCLPPTLCGRKIDLRITPMQGGAMTKADTLFPQEPDGLKTVPEVAAALGRSEAMVLHYIAKGWLPAIDQRQPGQRGRPRKMVRAGDIFRVAFQPRWEMNRKSRVTSTGARLHPTTLPEN
jgi:hypothetical protein